MSEDFRLVSKVAPRESREMSAEMIEAFREALAEELGMDVGADSVRKVWARVLRAVEAGRG